MSFILDIHRSSHFKRKLVVEVQINQRAPWPHLHILISILLTTENCSRFLHAPYPFSELDFARELLHLDDVIFLERFCRLEEIFLALALVILLQFEGLVEDL
jgi:hypothetical protein